MAEYCSTCHGIPSPARHSADAWTSTTRRMFLGMEHMAHMGRMMGGTRSVPVPTRAEEREILAYLRSHALAAVGEESVPEAGSEAAELFADACSRCHDLPDPELHPAQEWPAVVERMRRHMRDAGVQDLSAPEARAVTAYLERAGGPAP